MSQTIKIARIEIKEGDNARGHWQNFVVIGEDGSKTSTFDTSASGLKEGDTIEAEIELKGKYANLKTFKLIEHGAPSPLEGEGSKSAQRETPGQRESIEAQTAVKAIAELRVANALTDNSPEYKAMLEWCRQKLNATSRSVIANVIETNPKPLPQTVGAVSSVVKAETNDVAPKDTKEPAKQPEQTTDTSLINLDWLKKQLETLQWAGVLKWIKDNLGITGKTVRECVAQMDKEQATRFTKEVQDRLGMA